MVELIQDLIFKIWVQGCLSLAVLMSSRLGLDLLGCGNIFGKGEYRPKMNLRLGYAPKSTLNQTCNAGEGPERFFRKLNTARICPDPVGGI